MLQIYILTPLDQFEVYLLLKNFSLEFLFTNLNLYLLVSPCFLYLLYSTVCVLLTFFVRIAFFLFFEFSLRFIEVVVTENIDAGYAIYAPYSYNLFISILNYNLVGIIPYSFTTTSHLTITVYLAFSAFIGINLIGISTNNLAIFNLFLPEGVPFSILPILIIIELVSYIARAFSLSIRLFANMMAGHTLLKILAGFSWSIVNVSNFFFVFTVLPTLVILAITVLEIAIGALQAYVFIILFCIYINDVLHLH